MDENNSRLLGVNQDYDLLRTRVYADLVYNDRLRFFAEFIDAHRFGGELPALPIDENRSDFLNAFVELPLPFLPDDHWYGRVGRQELLLGSQRLVSTLEWANTRRTFEGVRVFRRTDNSNFDLWWSQPVIADPSNWDQVDGNQHFVGAWYTTRPCEHRTFDFYYLYLGNSSPLPQLGVAVPGFNVHSFGTRAVRKSTPYLYDYEAVLQLGNRGDQDIIAGAVTVGHGLNLKELWANPTCWIYYDWASGDQSPGAGSHTTFHQLFPFGHYYLSFVDVVGRQNIHDINFHWNCYPRNWLSVIAQYGSSEKI